MGEFTPLPADADGQLAAAEIAYKEAVRAGNRRSEGLNSFRDRAATIFTVSVLVMAFFGQTLEPRGLGGWAWAAIVFFVVGVVAPGIAISVPFKRKWTFGLRPSGVISNTDSGMNRIQVFQRSSEGLEGAYEKARPDLERIALLLQIQCGALALEVVCWTVELARG